MKIQDKAIGAIAAIFLLLVISLVAIVGFQGWFNEYSSNLAAKAEINTHDSSVLKIDYVENTGSIFSIYVKNSVNSYAFISEVKVDKVVCTLDDSDVIAESTTTRIDLSGCSVSVGTKSEILLVTDFGLFQEKHIVK